MKNKELKIGVSPIIYNNGNRKITLKIADKEVHFMKDNFIINDELKELLLNDNDLTEYFSIYLLHSLYKKDDDDLKHLYLYDDFKAFKSLMNSNTELKESLNETYKEVISNDLINKTIQDYDNLRIDEAKVLIYTLTRLLFLQNKYKDDEIGQKIDEKIKEYIEYIKEYDDDAKRYERLAKNQDKELTKRILNARLLFHIIPQLNVQIHATLYHRPFMSLWDYDVAKMQDLYNFILNGITNNTEDSKTYRRFIDDIENFINELETNVNMANFERDKADIITKIKEKYNVKDDLSQNITIPTKTKDAFIEELTNAYMDYLKDNEVKIYTEQDDKDVVNKSYDFIKHVTLYDPNKATLNLFNMDYTLKHLAYSKYQKEAYKTNLKEPLKVYEPTEKKKSTTKRKLNAKELKEKYKDETLLNGKKLDYNRKWARVGTNKVTTNIMDLREQVTKLAQTSNISKTRKKIKDIERKTKPTKEDLKDLKELKETLKEQEKEHEQILKEANDLKADLKLIDKTLLNTQDAKQIKELTKQRKKIQKQLDEREKILKTDNIYMQADLFKDKLLVAEKKDKRKKENYKLMVANDYDIQNFNSEGRNFLYYIPNIPNIINELDEDFITLDINDYLDFTGRPTGNVSRIRNNLFKTLKEMRKESYDYSFIDDKGELQEGSLVLIGDIKSTEYKGKATIQAQLGATFKSNLKETLTKSQYVKVNSDVFKIGQGKNNKAETMAKEIFLYLSKLCRIEAKKQDTTGQWQKDLRLDTIITKLCELNLINYNPNRYNETVKEPLLYALNIGMEKGYFKYETDAFKYYDEVTSTLNKGANVKDKITNFETGDRYGIRFTLNSDMVDLEANQKANKTYKANKKKYEKKSNK